MILPDQIKNLYPTVVYAGIEQAFHPEEGWVDLDCRDLHVRRVDDLARQGYTTASLVIVDREGITLARRSDWTLEELEEGLRS